MLKVSLINCIQPSVGKKKQKAYFSSFNNDTITKTVISYLLKYSHMNWYQS